MGINKLPTMKSYWSVDEGLGNSLIQKVMTRARFLEILQNIHFDHLGKHVQDMLKPEAHQSIDEHMCKFKRKRIMRQYMKMKT